MSPIGHYTSLSSYTSCCLSYLSFSAEGLHRSTPLRRPFRRMVCTAITYLSFSADGLQRGLTCLLQAITHLAVSATGSAPLYSSADGLQRPLPTCPFRRMVCRAPLLVLFGERSPVPGSPTCPSASTGSTHGLHLHLPYVLLSFSADGPHILSHVSPFIRRAPTTPR